MIETPESSCCHLEGFYGKEIVELASIVNAMSYEFDKPLDVEFAISDGKINILQQRPYIKDEDYKIKNIGNMLVGHKIEKSNVIEGQVMLLDEIHQKEVNINLGDKILLSKEMETPFLKMKTK